MVEPVMVNTVPKMAYVMHTPMARRNHRRAQSTHVVRSPVRNHTVNAREDFLRKLSSLFADIVYLGLKYSFLFSYSM